MGHTSIVFIKNTFECDCTCSLRLSVGGNDFEMHFSFFLRKSKSPKLMLRLKSFLLCNRSPFIKYLHGAKCSCFRSHPFIIRKFSSVTIIGKSMIKRTGNSRFEGEIKDLSKVKYCKINKIWDFLYIFSTCSISICPNYAFSKSVIGQGRFPLGLT